MEVSPVHKRCMVVGIIGDNLQMARVLDAVRHVAKPLGDGVVVVATVDDKIEPSQRCRLWIVTMPSNSGGLILLKCDSFFRLEDDETTQDCISFINLEIEQITNGPDPVRRIAGIATIL